MAKRGRKREGVKRLRAADTFPDVSPSTFSAASVDETKALWEPYYGRSLTDDEAREILANASNFVRALMEAAKKPDDSGD